MTDNQSAPRPRPKGDFSPEAGAVVKGRYRLERVLGRGGMGAVWAGWDEELERTVAVKFMAPQFAEKPSLRERFTREAKAAARLRTRHVTQVFDFGVDGNTPFIVMEFLDGEDLRTCLRRTKRLPLSEITRIVRHICKALTRAREAGIVHRDLKPGNVFLSQADGEDVVKVLDFGVAKVDAGPSSDATKTGVVLGSPPYLSPEQARGLPIDHRSDLWSVAAVAFRAITGRTPFRGRTDADTIVKICTEQAPPPSKYVKGLPATLDAFFAKAFSLDPDKRFQDANGFADSFAEAVGQPRAGMMSIPDGRTSQPFPSTPVPISGEPLSVITEVDSMEISGETKRDDSGEMQKAPSTVAGISSDTEEVALLIPKSQTNLRIPLAIGGAAVALLLLVVLVTGGDSESQSEPASQSSETSAETTAAAPKPDPDPVVTTSAASSSAPSKPPEPPAPSSAKAAAKPKPAPVVAPVPRGPRPKPKPDRWGY